MVSYIREIVSGKRRRTKETGLNIDLSYITSRIIAMSFPASGIESLYRNHIDDVEKYIKQRHPDHYFIFNLSGAKYNYQAFDYRINDQYWWLDHHAPTISTLYELAHRIKIHLLNDPENVVIIHCKAGKGRTGTVICATLIFLGFCNSPEEASEYYSRTRFHIGHGLTIPSQLRYVDYFHQIYKSQVICPLPRLLTQLVFKTVPTISKGGIKPYIYIYQLYLHGQHKKKIFDSRKDAVQSAVGFVLAEASELQSIQIIPDTPLICVGDIFVQIFHEGIIKDQLLCRFTFNTSFVIHGKLVLTKGELDPPKIKRDPRYHPNFGIEVHLGDVCEKKCNSRKQSGELCDKCKPLVEGEIKQWKKIHAALQLHNYPRKEEKLAGNEIVIEEEDLRREEENLIDIEDDF